MAKFSDYYTLSLKNRRLTNDLYKKMISLNKHLLGRISIGAFKAAYHSSRTQAEVRALLTYSLFSSEPINTDRLKSYENPRKPIEKKHFKLVVRSIGGKPQLYFRNLGFNRHSAQYEVYRMTNTQVRWIRGWEPTMKNKGKALMNAILIDNVHAQKIYTLMSNSTIAVVAMADIMSKNIRFNDPMRLFYETSGEGGSKDSYAHKTISYDSIRGHQMRFKLHLNHMKEEFEKYFSKLEKLGIDTTVVSAQLNKVDGLVTTFITNNEAFEQMDTYEGSNELAVSLYEIHHESRNTIDALITLADAIENFDVNSVSIYEIERLEVVEPYVDYKQSKQMFREQILDKNAMSILKNIRARLERLDTEALSELDSISGKELFDSS